MEVICLAVLKYLISPTILSIIVNVIMSRYRDRKSLENEAPDIFVKQIRTIENLKNLNKSFLKDKCYFLAMDSYIDSGIQKEIVNTQFTTISDMQSINIKNTMLYIHIRNDHMDGAEIKMLDSKGREIKLSSWQYHFICKNDSIGLLINFYERPAKIYIIYRQNVYEYNIYRYEGSIEVRKTRIEDE